MKVKHGFKPKSKYNAKQTYRGEYRFDSAKEAMYYDQLLLRQKAGEVLFFLRQVPFHLPGNVKYIVDFVEYLSDGSVTFIDVKGFITPLYTTKKKQVEALYPIKIIEC